MLPSLSIAAFRFSFRVIANMMKQTSRNLNVHEHVAYKLLNESCIPTPEFRVSTTAEEAGEHATELCTEDLVLKAQVLAGGRGKGFFKGTNIGGVKMCETSNEAEALAKKMIGNLLVTKQTGAAGRICNSVMVTKRMFPRKEFYLAIMLERAFNGPVIIASTQGGVNIEEVAASNPEAITYEPIDIKTGLTSEQAGKIVTKMGLDKIKSEMKAIMCSLYQLFVAKDALLLEINPFAEDAISGNYLALDCKCRFDDNAEFRQQELFALRDWSQEDPREVTAAKFDLNYIPLDGNIGCMVNGAGLAMATMDIIKLHGGEPANFLDVGGAATFDTIKEAFKLITSDPKVATIFVNIFGGIVKCDTVAEGIVAAVTDLKLAVPVIVRLQGTRVAEGKAVIAKSKAKLVPVDDLAEAASVAVTMSQIVQLAKCIDVTVQIGMNTKKNQSC